MSRSRQASRAIDPIASILRGEVEIEDFLSEEELVEAMFAARWRIIRVFANARSAPQQGSTPGYLAGLDSQIGSVAAYIQRVMPERAQAKIYSSGDLPGQYRNCPRQTREHVARFVRFELYVRLLLIMREANDLWYVSGEWTMPPSVLDEYRLRFREGRQSYRNERSFHGRPGRDRDRLGRLGLAPGVSTAVS